MILFYVWADMKVLKPTYIVFKSFWSKTVTPANGGLSHCMKNMQTHSRTRTADMMYALRHCSRDKSHLLMIQPPSMVPPAAPGTATIPVDRCKLCCFFGNRPASPEETITTHVARMTFRRSSLTWIDNYWCHMMELAFMLWRLIICF